MVDTYLIATSSRLIIYIVLQSAKQLRLRDIESNISLHNSHAYTPITNTPNREAGTLPFDLYHRQRLQFPISTHLSYWPASSPTMDDRNNKSEDDKGQFVIATVREVDSEVHDQLPYTVDRPRSKFARIYRSAFFQVLVVGALAFCGPAMADAISGLGGGGQATPYTVSK
jgi:hypothetical protein